jgi:putative spermidine/putrescine transport system substrate-binding protein
MTAVIALAVVAGAVFAAVGSGARHDAGSITVSTWGGAWTDAFKKNLGDPFSKATGIKVNYVINGDDVSAPVILQEQAHKVKIDVVDAGNGGELLTKNYLEPYPPSLVALLKKVSVPGTANKWFWTFGTVANMLACNPKVATRCPTNAKQFFDTKNFPGKRMMNTAAPNMCVFALLGAGVPKSQIAPTPANIQKCGEMLKAIKPSVSVWAASGSQQEQAIASGQVGMAVMWQSRIKVVEDSGTAKLKWYWTDSAAEADTGLLVPKGAPNKANAFAFIKWVATHPKNQAGFAGTLGTFVAGKTAPSYLSAKDRSWQASLHPVLFWPTAAWYKQGPALQKMWQSSVG